MGAAAMRKSWCTVWVGLGLALCLAGCQGLFPRPVYSPPAASAPQAPPPPPQVLRPTFYVTVNRLNLRACPGMDCPKIAVLDRNQEVEKVGDAEDWSQIRVKQIGTIGWVSSRYLSPTPVAATPEVAPPPTLPEEVTPPPLPERPEKAKPAPEKPPAVEKPPKTPKPGEGPTPPVKKKPEEAHAGQTGQTGKDPGPRATGGEAGETGQTGPAGRKARAAGETGAAGCTRARKARQNPDYVVAVSFQPSAVSPRRGSFCPYPAWGLANIPWPPFYQTIRKSLGIKKPVHF